MKNSMKVLQIKKPVVENRTGIGKMFDRLMNEVDMPINNWCREQARKNKKIKI